MTATVRADPSLHGMSKEDESKYERMFQKLGGASGGYLRGKQAVALLSKSGLPQDTLAKVWTLADSDLDGRLSVKVGLRLVNVGKYSYSIVYIPSADIGDVFHLTVRLLSPRRSGTW